MSVSFHSFDVPTPAGVTEEQARSAALWLAENAKDAADRWNLLEACGLLPYKRGKPDHARAEDSALIKHPAPGQ